jgi:hypothetical protein
MKSMSAFGRATFVVIALGWLLPAVSGVRAGAPDQVPEEARRHLQEALGQPFVVFREKVQDDLKLSDEQKQKLDEGLQEQVQEAMQLFQKLDGLKHKEREKALGEYRPKAHQKLAKLLTSTLTENQLRRLRQVELQQDGVFALGQPEVARKLKITDEQRKRFIAVVEDLQKKVQPLIKEAESGGQPEEIRPKMLKLRKEYEGKIEAILSDAQKKEWKELLGKPLPLDD